jgi:23S rRNA pseudouridine1911/1915/1917 synthase
MDLIVIDKPAGLVVHPAPGNPDQTLVNALIAHCGASLSGIGGVARPGIVHRLDKDTSGLMIAAKTDLAHQGLAEQFQAHGRDGRLVRAYQAFVWGMPAPAAGRIEAPIGRNPKNRKAFAVTRSGKPAITHYKTLAGLGPASLVECRLETGRTHQIRVHMAHLGHPLLGDPVYGGRRTGAGAAARVLAKSLGRQALHAAELGFIHPRSGKRLLFKSALPKDLALLRRSLEGL